MGVSMSILNFSIRDGLTITQNKIHDDLPEGINKNLVLDLLSVIEKVTSQTEEPVKKDFYNDWLPSIRSAMVKAEKSLSESDMPISRPKIKDGTTASHKDSGGEA